MMQIFIILGSLIVSFGPILLFLLGAVYVLFRIIVFTIKSIWDLGKWLANRKKDKKESNYSSSSPAPGTRTIVKTRRISFK